MTHHVSTEPFKLGQGLISEVIQSCQSLLLHTRQQLEEYGIIQRSYAERLQSYLAVPILSGSNFYAPSRFVTGVGGYSP